MTATPVKQSSSKFSKSAPSHKQREQRIVGTMVNSSTSVRYQRLLEVLDLALTKSRSQFDVEQAVRQCYGDGDNEVFYTMLEGILDHLHTEVTADMMSFLREKGVEEKLLKLEAVIAKLDRDAAAKKQVAAKDKESAVAALQNAKLPANITPQDLVQYRTYQRMLQEKKLVQDEIDALEKELAELEAVRANSMETADARIGEMQAAKAELEQSADLCSMVS
jgi:Nnf1